MQVGRRTNAAEKLALVPKLFRQLIPVVVAKKHEADSWVLLKDAAQRRHDDREISGVRIAAGVANSNLPSALRGARDIARGESA